MQMVRRRKQRIDKKSLYNVSITRRQIKSSERTCAGNPEKIGRQKEKTKRGSKGGRAVSQQTALSAVKWGVGMPPTINCKNCKYNKKNYCEEFDDIIIGKLIYCSNYERKKRN